MTVQLPQHLQLVRIGGPRLEQDLRLEGPGVFELGRNRSCDVVLPDPAVSRLHAEIRIEHTALGHGFTASITDRGSRHGVTINGGKIRLNAPIELSSGDEIAIGPWTFSVQFGLEGSGGHVAVPREPVRADGDDAVAMTQVTRIDRSKLSALAAHRLELLLDSSEAFHSASDETMLARRVLDVLLEGTGFGRCAIVRNCESSDKPPAAEDLEIVAQLDRSGDSTEKSEFRFSTSLIVAASSGQAAQLSYLHAPRDVPSPSVVSLGIHSAFCAPVFVGETLEAFLYLDARGNESHVPPDFGAYCLALARLFGLALANIRRRALEEHQRLLQTELDAARKAQMLILPERRGQVGPIEFAFRMVPGRYVAGDLFDVIPIDENRTAFLIGDVSGKGVGAALIMAAAQAVIRENLQLNQNVEDAVNRLNRIICARPFQYMVTLWVGMFDAAHSRLTYVDAGHGHWLIREADDVVVPAPSASGPPLGVLDDLGYELHTIERIDPGTRIILFSDGLVEQQRFITAGRATETSAFGLNCVIEIVRVSSDVESDVNCLERAVVKHAGQPDLTDDLTVASIGIRPL